MVLCTMGTTSKERNMEKDDLNGVMEVYSQGTSTIIISKGKELTSGMTVDVMKETGKIIKWMDKVYSLGLMVGSMKGSIKRT